MKIPTINMVFVVMFAMHSQIQTNPEKNKPSVLENIVIGSCAAMAEVAIDQPLVYFKNSIQQGKSISWSPKIWYRGLFANLFGLVPVTAAQVTINHMLLEYLKKHHNEPTTIDKITAACGAGAMAALIASPTELVMLQQQNSGQNVYSVIKQIMSKSPQARRMLRGFMPTAVRDGGFTAGYLAISPLIQDKAKEYISNEVVTSIGSGIAAGLVATTITHPWDTIKTKMQASLENPSAKSMLKTTQSIYNNEGIKGFFKGISARGLRVASAITIMSSVTRKATEFIEGKSKHR